MSECDNCRYSYKHYGQMSCRINPPTLGKWKESEYQGLWPLVNSDDWCGKHEPK